MTDPVNGPGPSALGTTQFPALASDFLSGARGVKEMIAEALVPDADGVARVTPDELTDILDGYRDSAGGLLDGRSSIEAYAGKHKPALLAALTADRNGEGDPWDAYRSTQIGIDMNSSGASTTDVKADHPHGDVGSLSWAFGRIVDMLKKGAEMPKEVNSMGSMVEQVLPAVASGADLSDADFEAIRSAALDPTVYSLLALRLSSINRAPLQKLAGDPSMNKAEFVQFLRTSDYSAIS